MFHKIDSRAANFNTDNLYPSWLNPQAGAAVASTPSRGIAAGGPIEFAASSSLPSPVAGANFINSRFGR
jgi:hypothetical protein